ncbi:MAG: EAL domain-containing protein [Thermoleophilaceae bacterium]
MTPRDENTAEAHEPANLAEVAIGLSHDQLAKYEGIIDRFLGGRYFSIDEEGKVAGWNGHAEKRFGWSSLEVVGEDFFEYIAVDARDELMPTLRGERGDPAGCELQLATKRRDGAAVETGVALVPIRVGDGYPLNKVLQDIVTHRGNPIEITRMKKRHADVLRLLITALDGGEMPDPLGDDDWQPGGGRVEHRWQPAGALVVFDDSGAVADDAAPAAEGAEAAQAAELRPAQDDALERLRDENHELRRKLREAEREAEVLRDELDEARMRGSGQRGRRPSEAGDPSIAPEHISRALREDGFTLHCQPVLDLRQGAISQHEVLLRMVGPDGELVLPQAFFGTARRAGLTTAIDQWVVRHAIRTIGEQAKVGRDVTFEVNLSSESLHDAGLLPTIERELATTGIDPGRLVLEVTEQIAIADPEGARSLAKHLRAIGCGFALDDFGTSFGSFRFLKDMPVDYLKIDGDLIVSLAESRTAQLVVKALVDVARGTGADTIAVFASDDRTLELLRELGVGYAQGHKVGRPRSIAEALSELEAQGLRPVEAPVAQVAAGTANRAK